MRTDRLLEPHPPLFPRNGACAVCRFPRFWMIEQPRRPTRMNRDQHAQSRLSASAATLCTTKSEKSSARFIRKRVGGEELGHKNIQGIQSVAHSHGFNGSISRWSGIQWGT